MDKASLFFPENMCTYMQCQVWVTGRLKRPILVTSGSSHQPPSLTQRMDEQLCAEGEQYTQRARERERWRKWDRWGSRKKWERISHGEGAWEVFCCGAEVHTPRALNQPELPIRASEKGSFLSPYKCTRTPSSWYGRIFLFSLDASRSVTSACLL